MLGVGGAFDTKLLGYVGNRLRPPVRSTLPNDLHPPLFGVAVAFSATQRSSVVDVCCYRSSRANSSRPTPAVRKMLASVPRLISLFPCTAPGSRRECLGGDTGELGHEDAEVTFGLRLQHDLVLALDAHVLKPENGAGGWNGWSRPKEALVALWLSQGKRLNLGIEVIVEPIIRPSYTGRGPSSR